ncbi:GAF domain-like protein [Auriculariales sp. MPI-PUGE-AT-0066]|nr:GAF domain-like protein [Auriculariales sp. MPI-PUGE-AT-0066]
MPHADSALIPSYVTTKSEFWQLVGDQLDAVLDPGANWVTTLANTASLVYHSLYAFHLFGSADRQVNWCGFYLESSHFPGPPPPPRADDAPILLLGPFSGKPACQRIVGRDGHGVCADAFASGHPVIVSDVELYPGHIACDGETRSEIVLPLVAKGRTIGVLDLDCLAHGAFDEEDRVGLERVVSLVVQRAHWTFD